MSRGISVDQTQDNLRAFADQLREYSHELGRCAEVMDDEDLKEATVRTGHATAVKSLRVFEVFIQEVKCGITDALEKNGKFGGQ